MVGLGAGVTVEFAVGTGVDVSSVGRSSSSKAVGSPWETTTKANGSKRNGGRMAQGSLMMLEVNIECNSISRLYIVVRITGATKANG